MWTLGQDDGFYVSPHHSHNFLKILDEDTLFQEAADNFASANTFPLCEKHKEFGKMGVIIKKRIVITEDLSSHALEKDLAHSGYGVTKNH